MEESKSKRLKSKQLTFLFIKKNEVNTNFYFLMDIAKHFTLSTLSSFIMVLSTFIF